ncbi:MAG: monofunctional biosynthetic peptidoglycan transglycosylase [bacterium]|nr:monofunctional biosynthetic peptidoglycan transglycosylase [bacterium]
MRRVFWFLSFLVITCALFVVYLYLTLPGVAYLKNKNPKSTAIMEQRKREALSNNFKYTVHQQWVRFDRIPQLLKDTVRISEDGAFFQHNGFDLYELKEAFKRNLKEGKKVRGASTITQQLAKNLFLSTGKSYRRKIKELFLALNLEWRLSKNRIFHIYLNIIEFGRGIFGVEAAARHYFKKPVSQLNVVEILRLTAVIPKPLRVSPLKDSRYIKWRANLLLERLKRYRYISGAQYKKAKLAFK